MSVSVFPPPPEGDRHGDETERAQQTFRGSYPSFLFFSYLGLFCPVVRSGWDKGLCPLVSKKNSWGEGNRFGQTEGQNTKECVLGESCETQF